MCPEGPMQGQASHFFRFAKEKIPYGINRYQNETDRLYQVLNDSLEGKEWLANNEYSIADMASFPWVYAATIAGRSSCLTGCPACFCTKSGAAADTLLKPSGEIMTLCLYA